MSPKEGFLGGKVTGFEGPAPIAVGQVSRFSLVRYLLGQKPDLNLNPEKAQYTEIFQKLRGLPYPVQESLLVGFFTKEVKDFPNGESLGRKLIEINNIPWFKPKGEIDPTVLQKHVKDHLSRLGLNTLPLRIIDNWGTALDTVRSARWDTALGPARNATWDTARLAAMGAARGAVRNVAWDTAWDVAHEATWGAARAIRDTAWLAAWVVKDATIDAAQFAADDAAWVTIKDIMPNRGYKDNPFSPLTEIYKLGCWPIGVVPKEKGRQEFAIFIPQS